MRRFKAFNDCAKSWSRVERIIARVEVGDQGTDTVIAHGVGKKGLRWESDFDSPYGWLRCCFMF
jgi:hypothetical protein